MTYSISDPGGGTPPTSGAHPRSRARVSGLLPHLAFIAGRLVNAIPTVFGIIILNFMLLQLAPGDAAMAIAAESGAASTEMLANLRSQFGRDKGLLEQLVNYFSELSRFSLGISPRFNLPVTEMIFDRLPSTLALMGMALVLAIAIGIPAGSLMARCAGRLPDRLMSFLVLIAHSVPAFWIGLMLIVLFSVKLGWLPTGGTAPAWSDKTGLALLAERARYLVLPALSLSLL